MMELGKLCVLPSERGWGVPGEWWLTESLVTLPGLGLQSEHERGLSLTQMFKENGGWMHEVRNESQRQQRERRESRND